MSAQDVTVTYEYDDLGRLKKATDTAGQDVEYEYDPAGNRTEQTITISADAPIADNIPTLGVGPNLVDISAWPTGSAPSGYALIPGWSYGATYYDETRWARVLGPGQSGLVTTMEAGQTNPDPNGGGANPSPTFVIDETRAYEFSVYFKKYDLSVQSLYLGTTPHWSIPQLRYVANNTEVSNPYFVSWNPTTQAANLDANKWYKIVGYVMPEGWPHESTSARGGVYDVATGAKVASVSNFRWHEDRTTDSHHTRFFTYYDESTQNTYTTHFYQPEVRITSLPAFTPVVPAISITPSDAAEGANLVYTLTLSAPTTVETRVNYSIAPGGSNPASTNDYSGTTSGSVEFAPGATQATVSVAAVNDGVNETNESVRLTLSAPVRMTLGETYDDALILDAPEFNVSNASVSEGGALSFTVTRTGPNSQTHAVSYSTTAGTSSPSDFTAVSGTLTFTASQTTKTVSVPTVEDSIHENDETVLLDLSSPTNGATINDGQGGGTITNDDPGPVFSVVNVSATEGGTMTFTVTKSGATSKSHNVNYATATGSALSADFTGTSGTLVFAASQSSRTVTVQTTQDSIYESAESLYLNLSSPTSGASLSPSQSSATGWIFDDDPPPNNPPVAVNDSLTLTQYQQVCMYPLVNDSDPDNHPLSIASITQPFGGTAILLSGNRVCITGFSQGPTSMTYVVSDGNGGTDTGTISLNVQGGGGIPQ
ncbi:MAG: Calx-beta domain-containing protein [Cyanobacteria bacterium J06648_11]